MSPLVHWFWSFLLWHNPANNNAAYCRGYRQFGGACFLKGLFLRVGAHGWAGLITNAAGKLLLQWFERSRLWRASRGFSITALLTYRHDCNRTAA